MTSPVSVVKVETEKIESPKEEELEWLTSRENCDACGFQAYYLVSFESGSLFFCRHHYLKNEDSFFDSAQDIVDESELLLGS
jgi:hypothetical protein